MPAAVMAARSLTIKSEVTYHVCFGGQNMLNARN
jgi:hypothetical protein